MSAKSTIQLPVTKVYSLLNTTMADTLAIEEPLEIRLEYGSLGQSVVQNISVTMRTPGNDAELATGFLLTEGIIKYKNDIEEVKPSFTCAEQKENTVVVKLKDGIIPDLKNTERNFYTTSSCGVCGKASINAIRTASVYSDTINENKVAAAVLHALPDALAKNQEIFSSTGGLHACALFDLSGQLLLVREDVGRHNALDKLIGAAWNDDKMPMDEKILLLSGRASFELIQKAAMAGIKIVAAVGAPSSLAVELAHEFNITLVGFLRSHRFNIYTRAERVILPVHKVANSSQNINHTH